MNRQAIINAARACVGSKWRRRGRDPETGLDCGGLVIVCAKSVGYPVYDPMDYRVDADGKLFEYMSRSFDSVPVEDMLPGDIPLFRMDPGKNDPATHCAVLNERFGLIHVYYHVREVVEQDMPDSWKSRILHVMRFRGIV